MKPPAPSLVVRTIAPHERAAVLQLLGEWITPEFFGRYFEHDPAFRDDLCFVGVTNDQIVSTLQVFTKEVRVAGATVLVGGIGNVFTTPAHRERGIASRLLRHAVASMKSAGFDLSLLFAVRLAFYGRHGWSSHPRRFLFMEPARPRVSDRYTIEPFTTASDLDAVMDLYSIYSGKLPGTTLRDRRYWLGQLNYAGNPEEDFLVARARDPSNRIVAYARGTRLYEYYVIMEHGYLPGHAGALSDLVCRLHGTEAREVPGTITQLATEPGIVRDLGARGLTLRTVEDVFWMWRLISPARLARKLGISAVEVAGEHFLHQLFPPDGSVFWLSDRF
jgi:GNAT superfamily N-acetyltransferase